MTTLSLFPDARLSPNTGLGAPGTPAPGGRSRRVARLLAMVVVLSIVDLAVTLGFMSTTGMYEGNPLIVLLTRMTNSALAIVVCKGLSVAAAVGLLYRLRSHRQAEVGAWIAVGVLSVLTAQWVRYGLTVSQLDLDTIACLAADPNWIVLR